MKYLILLFLISGYVNAAETHWNANQVRKYVHSSELQRRTNWKLISMLNLVGDENILDIGCGDGRTTSAVSDFVPNGKIHGLDPNLDMLTWAERQYLTDGYDNLSFSIGDYNTLRAESEYDLITGFYSFHIVASEKRDDALKLVHKALKTGGSVAMNIAPSPDTNPEFAASIGEQINSEKWSKFFKINKQKSSFCWENESTLRERFEKIKWSKLDFRFVSYKSPFVDKKEFSDWIQGTLDFVQKIPSEHRDEFVSDLIDNYVEKRPSALSSDGVYFGEWGYYRAIAVK